jgi:branched-chain amino acid transport system ATP-binding protein
MASESSGLVISELRAGYGSMEVVSGLTIQVAPSEIVSLIGRNGAGKTTSLLAVAGLRYGRNSGRVTVDGVDVSTASAPRVLAHGLAHVPEGHRILRTLTVHENLQLGAFGRRRDGRKAVKATIDRVQELFPILAKYDTRTAGYLSGGEQQMLAIGQALMAEPKYLMLDEPTSGLAQVVVQAILDTLVQLCDSGMGILLVEQNVSRALHISGRCYLMERGQIVMSGDSDVLIDNPKVTAIVRGTAEVDVLPAEPSHP